jgi:hypothetical protein
MFADIFDDNYDKIAEVLLSVSLNLEPNLEVWSWFFGMCKFITSANVFGLIADVFADISDDNYDKIAGAEVLLLVSLNLEPNLEVWSWFFGMCNFITSANVFGLIADVFADISDDNYDKIAGAEVLLLVSLNLEPNLEVWSWFFGMCNFITSTNIFADISEDNYDKIGGCRCRTTIICVDWEVLASRELVANVVLADPGSYHLDQRLEEDIPYHFKISRPCPF